MPPPPDDPNAARTVAETARRRVEARLRGSGRTLPPMPAAGSEAERLRAARAAIEALHRARGARVPDPVDPGPPTASSSVIPATGPSSAGPPPGESPPGTSRVRPRRPVPSPGERLGTFGRFGAVRAALAGAAALAIGTAGFLAGRSTSPSPVAALAAVDDAPTTGNASLVEDNLALQRGLVELEGRVDALRALLAPEAVAALAEADRELEMIELGSADPGAAPADVERVRRGVRDELERALGSAALATVREARGEPPAVQR